MTGLEYGNARLRARRARLLDGADFRRLNEAESLDRMLGLLGDTPYRQDVEAAVARYDGLHRLDGAVRTHLARSLRDLVSFYRDPEVPLVDLLLERWDLRNVRAILRVHARPEPAPVTEPLVVPAGKLGDAELRELAAQAGVRAAIDLLVAWRLPSLDTVRRLVAARADYEAGAEVAVLEGALNAAYATKLERVLSGLEDDAAAGVLRAEIDASNVVTALRLFRAGMGQTREIAWGEGYLPGGRLRTSVLDAVRLATSPDDALAALLEADLPAAWLAVLAQWPEDRDPAVVEERLRRAIAQRAVALFHGGDPLGAAIPVAYVFAKEAEARNLRLIGRRIGHGLPFGEIEPQLMVIG